jgi:hypothetical protein
MQQWGPRVINRRFIAYISVGSTGMSTNHLAVLDRKTGRATVSPLFGTTVLGSVDDRIVWVMTTGGVMAAALDGNGKLGPPKLVLEDVLVRPGGAAKATMSSNGSLIYQRPFRLAARLSTSTGRRAVRNRARAFGHPHWSPDGSRIAVAIGRTGGSDIWLIDARTKSLSSSQMARDWTTSRCGRLTATRVVPIDRVERHETQVNRRRWKRAERYGPQRGVRSL